MSLPARRMFGDFLVQHDLTVDIVRQRHPLVGLLVALDLPDGLTDDELR